MTTKESIVTTIMEHSGVTRAEAEGAFTLYLSWGDIRLAKHHSEWTISDFALIENADIIRRALAERFV